MGYEKFCKIFFSIIFIFVSVNLIIWNFFTKDILTNSSEKHTGDLSRMSYLTNLNFERKNLRTLEKKMIDINSYNSQNIDMITIGDSFSNGGAGGENRYYQDYLATKSNLNILNLHNLPNSRNSLETIVYLNNSGFLEKNKVKFILVECVQWAIFDRFSFDLDVTKNIDINEIHKIYGFNTSKKEIKENLLPDVSFINTGNFKFLAYNFLYNFSDKAFFSSVYKAQLDDNYFSLDKKDLIFYLNDIKYLRKINDENLRVVNDNLNALSNLLSKSNIKLIFMPAVNKYDLYSPYIINNKYPKDELFDKFRKLGKNYIFVDTKKILATQLEKKEKDIFYIDDAHWSFKASDFITTELSKELSK